MNRHLSILGILLFILTISKGCEKDVRNDISLEIKLVDEFGVQKSVFSQSDSLIFEFYLSNYSGKEATYLRPCREFGHYLNLYREDSEGNYVYCGRPEYYCAAIAGQRRIRGLNHSR